MIRDAARTAALWTPPSRLTPFQKRQRAGALQKLAHGSWRADACSW